MIIGDTVTVIRPTTTGTDEMGEPVAEDAKEAVAGVLFAPGGTSPLSESLRARGFRVDAEFHFPKGYTGSLAGCSIVHGEDKYEVVGDPQRYMDANTPGPWNMQVAARRVEG